MRLNDEQIKISTPHWWDGFKLRQARTIDFFEEVEGMTCFSKTMVAMMLESDRPITILLHSPGGDVLEGLGIFDTIMAARKQGIRVTIHGIGVVASMATVILQAASHRVMSPNSRMLLHQIRKFSFMSENTVSDAVEMAKELSILNDRLAEIVASRTGGTLTSIALKQMWSKDLWLWPEEALELGLIDEIALVNPR